ncbi:MAG: hypothetical protein J6T00_06495 [Bacteroidaceae bacterium]|nr:hypothetical protein [Bacteroidaceae bacterium]
MKTKFFFLLAALLLNVCAFAQSENTTPLKGDVNNDGTVDVADINAVIEIMKNSGGTGEETKYYWYIGQTKPTNLSSDPTVTTITSASSIPNNSWVNQCKSGEDLVTLSTSITKLYGRGINGDSTKPWYVAIPSDLGLIPTASDYTTPDTAVAYQGTITVNGKVYKYYSYNPGTRCGAYYAKLSK